MPSSIRIALFVLMPFLSSGFGHSYSKGLKSNSEIKACGSALADAVADVCENVYNEKKRGDIRPHSNDVLDPDYFYNHEMFIDTDSPYPFRSKSSVSSALKPVRTKREVRIVDECCRKACTVKEMLGYCG